MGVDHGLGQLQVADEPGRDPHQARTEQLAVLSLLTKLSLAAVVGAACTAVPADPDTDAGADPLVAIVDEVMAPAIGTDALADLDRCVGAVVAVVTPEQTLVLGYGATTAGGVIIPGGDTPFQVASLTKVYTGLALARQVARGDLTATAPAATIVAADLATALAGTSFTLADLATHHAGFPVFPSNLVDRDGDGAPDPGADPLSPAAGYARDDLERFLAGLTPPPDAPYAYSNLGAGLLGIALADDLGLSGYHALLRRLVADDLGMTQTWGAVSAMDATAQARVAQGYALQNGVRVPGHLAEMGVLAGGGEIVTTGNDLASLLVALTGARPTALDDAAAIAVTPAASGPNADTELGYAIEIEHLPDGDRFGKAGGTASYTSYLSFRRAPAVGVGVMTSCGGFTAVHDLATTIDDRITALTQ